MPWVSARAQCLSWGTCRQTTRRRRHLELLSLPLPRPRNPGVYKQPLEDGALLLLLPLHLPFKWAVSTATLRWGGCVKCAKKREPQQWSGQSDAMLLQATTSWQIVNRDPDLWWG